MQVATLQVERVTACPPPFHRPEKPMKHALAATLGLAIAHLFAAQPAQATILTFDITDPVRYPVSEDFPEGFGESAFTNYGDRVSGPTGSSGTAQYGYGVGSEGYTPHVTVQYGPYSLFTGGPQLWRYDYGDLDRVMYQGSTGSVGFNYDHLDIVLTGDPGFDVVLYGFDLAGWSRADYTIDSVVVFDGIPFPFLTPTNQLATLHDVDVEGSQGHTSIEFATPLRGRQLWLTINARNLGDGSLNIGIDNLRFGEVQGTDMRDLPPAPLEDQDPGRFAVPEPAPLLLLALGLAGLGLGQRRRR